MRPERRRQSIWFGIVVVVAFFVGVTLAVAWLDTGSPDIPHDAGGDTSACVSCHSAERLPASHHDRVGQDCRSCHSPQAADAADVSADAELPPAASSTTGGRVSEGSG